MVEKFTLGIISSIGSVKSLIFHTVLFVGSFSLYFFGINIHDILDVVTNIVSLEAIYLSILIQMSVNFQTKKLQSVASDVEDMQKDVEDIQENVEDIQEDMEDDEDADMVEIRETLNKLMKEVSAIKNKKNNNEK